MKMKIKKGDQMYWHNSLSPDGETRVIPIDDDTIDLMTPAAVENAISKLQPGEEIFATNLVYKCKTLRRAWIAEAKNILLVQEEQISSSWAAKENCLILKGIIQRIEETEPELIQLMDKYPPTFSIEGDGYRILSNLINEIKKKAEISYFKQVEWHKQYRINHPIEPVSVDKKLEGLHDDNTRSMQKKTRRHTPHQVYSDEMIMDYYRCRLKKNMKCYEAAMQTLKKSDFEITEEKIESFTHSAAQRWKIFTPEQKKIFSIK